MDIKKWHPRAVCPDCGFHAQAYFGEVFHTIHKGTHVRICPDCGCKVREGILARDREWRVETMRFTSTSHLLEPSSWGTGYWEILITPGTRDYRWLNDVSLPVIFTQEDYARYRRKEAKAGHHLPYLVVGPEKEKALRCSL